MRNHTFYHHHHHYTFNNEIIWNIIINITSNSKSPTVSIKITNYPKNSNLSNLPVIQPVTTRRHRQNTYRTVLEKSSPPRNHKTNKRFLSRPVGISIRLIRHDSLCLRVRFSTTEKPTNETRTTKSLPKIMSVASDVDDHPAVPSRKENRVPPRSIFSNTVSFRLVPWSLTFLTETFAPSSSLRSCR